MDALLDQARDIYEGEIVSSTPPFTYPNLSTNSPLPGLPRPKPRRHPHDLPPRRKQHHRCARRLHNPRHLQNSLPRTGRDCSYFSSDGTAMAFLQQEA
jgi:hypothetical protein